MRQYAISDDTICNLLYMMRQFAICDETYKSAMLENNFHIGENSSFLRKINATSRIKLSGHKANV